MIEHLKQLWIGKWQHPYIATTTDISPDLAEFLAEILDDVSLEMILLFYGWGCRTFQTASHIHVMIHIQCLKPLKQLWMGLWQNTHTATTIDVSPDLGELAEILDDVRSVEMIPLPYGWDCRTFQTAYHIHVIHIEGI